MCGPTGCTSTSGSPRSGGAPFTSSGCAPTGPRSWSRSPTGWAGSTESWAELLGDLRRRGMQAPVLAVGDGALGLWAALGEVFPATRAQRCWVHKTAKVLARCPKSVHPGARRALAEISQAERRDQAAAALEAFTVDYGVTWPKAV